MKSSTTVFRVAIVAGTRPEVIKLAPVYHAFCTQTTPPKIEPLWIATGQHEDLQKSALKSFAITPTVHVHTMAQGTSLASLLARLLTAIDDTFAQLAPDFVLVQGDTMTTQAAALAAFYRHIPYGHVEAGLRSGDFLAPFPEELNRRVVSLAATRHFAPTSFAKANLLKEGVSPSTILVTGNTAIDALFMLKEKPSFPLPLAEALDRGMRLVLITAHRRENQGGGLAAICAAVNTLASRFPDVFFVLPIHANPVVYEEIHRSFHPARNAMLILPLSYASLVTLMRRASLVLTDSGGLQEEAPALHVPVLILRTVTERPEGVLAGCAKLVGTETDRIVEEATRLLTDPKAHAAMANIPCPFGDGAAAGRISEAVRAYLSTAKLQ